MGVIWQKNAFDPGYHSEWPVKHYVTAPEDYDVLAYVFRDEFYEPDLEGFLAADRQYGPNGLAIPRAAGFASKATTGNPARARFRPMRWPMIPTPTRPTVCCMNTLLL